MLGKTEQEVFQLQSANNKLQLQLQVTKDSMHTQLNASIHDFQSYKDHISNIQRIETIGAETFWTAMHKTTLEFVNCICFFTITIYRIRANFFL
jgi:prefoldin subunit 5